METIVTVADGQLWTKKTGQGLPVLLISGGPGVESYLQPVATLLEPYCEVIVFDALGCGRSSYTGEGYTVEEALQHLEQIRSHYNFAKWLVVGHSWGADVALAYAVAYPESLLGAVYIAGTGIQNDRDWKEAYRVNKETIGEQLPAFTYPVNKVVHRALIESWRSYIKQPALLAQLATTSVRACTIIATHDIRPSWPSRQLAALMSHHTLVEIAAPHYIWLHDAAALQQALVPFIASFEQS